MSAHTPGPWTHRVATGSGATHIVGAAGRAWIATLEHRAGSSNSSNARLIAAAPELLMAACAALRYDEAIRACANDPDKMSSHCSAEGDTLDTLYDEWITAAQASVAKAEAKS